MMLEENIELLFNVNAVAGLALAILSYRRFARSWSATTGRFKVGGKVVAHEFEEYGAVGIATVFVSYQINHRCYLTQLKVSGHLKALEGRQPPIFTRYPVGASVDVFYAPKEPDFASVGAPPSIKMLRQRCVIRYFLLPLSVVNLSLLLGLALTS